MAESYRGLTIRIGGDTTKLTKALKTANGAISGTQQELRKLEQALRLDPANVEALGLKMGFVENQAQNTAMRLAQLRDAMDETGSRKILDDNGLQTTVAELAKVSDEFGNIGGEVENASMKLAQARATMNQATESLASMHNEVTSLAQSAAKVESARVAAALDLSEGVPSAEKVKELFASLPSYVAQDEKAVDALIEAIGKAGDSTDGLDKLVEKASQLKGVTFNFANDNTDVKTMTDALEDMAELLGGEAFDRTRIQGFGEEIERLQAALATAQDETERWTLVTEFQDLVAEIAKGESSMERFNRVLSDMGLPSEVSQGLAEVMANAKALGESQGSLASLGAALESAFNAKPENLELLEAAITAYASAGQVAVERTEALSQRLDALGAKDIEIDPLKSATQQLFEASEAADKAGGEYNDLQGKIAHVETVLAKLNATADENKRILSDDEREAIFNEEHVRSVEQMNQRLSDYRSRLAAAEEAARKASSALESARIRKEIEDVSGEIAKAKTESDKAYESLAKLTGMQGVKDAAGESLREVRELGTAFESAAARAQALQKWSKLDPTNTAAATDAANALGDAAEIAKERIKAIDSAIKSLSSDDVTKVTSAFGTAEEAVKRTSDAFTRVKRASDEAMKALSDAMKSSGLAGLEEAVLAADDSIESELSPEIAKLRDNVLALDSALEDVESGMQAAFNGQAIESLTNARADTMKGLADAVGASSSDYEAAFQHSIDRVADLAARAGREIVDSANTIDSAFRDMKKTVNGTEDDFRALREEAVKFSQTNAVSSDTLLEMESLGGQLGVTVDKLQSFGEVASHLDIATDIGASDIALQMGQLSNIMSDFSYDNFENFADSLVRLGNNTATTESAIMNVAQRMAAVANVTSMTTPELLSWAAAIASTGMRSESAATAITKTITGIGQAVASGGKTLQAFADIAKMSSEKFEQAWRTSSSDALEAFVKGLEELTDDSTDAIDALESVGIKSVRQSTAMLALSQTIDNLDKSLEMSVDAWNGIGDEWGQAGDAAREAHNKSDGFSGSLAIMQNNAQNLAATLGDGMIPFMDALATVMRLVTDALNAMPGPLKTAVVEFGALTIAVNVLSATMKGLGFDATKAGLMGMVEAEGAATLASGLLSAALKAIPVIGWVAAATVAVNTLAGFMGDAINDTGLLIEATSDLTHAVDGMSEAYKAAKGDTESLEDMRNETNETLRTVANLGDTMSETWTSLGSNVGAAERYASVINELGNQGSITATDLATLSNAVGEYNKITGSSIEVTNDKTGALNLNAKAIDEVTEAYRRQAEQQAYTDLYNDAIKQRIDVEEKLRVAREQLTEAEETWGLRIGGTGIIIGEQMDKYRELQRRVQDYEEVLKSTDGVIDSYEKHLGDAAGSFDDMDTALVAAGASLKDFAALPDEVRDKVSTAFEEGGRTAKALADALAACGLSADSMTVGVSGATTATEELTKATEDQIEALKEANARAYTAKKRELDDEYDDLKAAKDAEYDTLKRQYDEEYKLAQRAYDAAYEQRKRELDRQYEALKSALDAEEDQRKRELDAAYDALKDALDKEADAIKRANDQKLKEYKAANDAIEKEQKRSNDARYDELKDALDREQRDLKRHNEKLLKDYKKTQDDLVDDFKDATDARIKEMEREYKAQLKMLEKQSGIDEIDDKIEQLQAETEAEKRELEHRKQQDKIAELQKEVDRAKSRRKRQEAEEKLNEYLLEVQTKRNEEERSDQIADLKKQKENLKDALDERKDQLKQDYDDRKDAYQKQRSEELEALQGQLSDEYDAYKQQLDDIAQDRKDANDQRLDDFKQQLDDELQATKDSHDLAEDEYKQRLDDELQAAKDSHALQLDELKAANQLELEELKAAHSLQLEAVKLANTDELNALKYAQADELQNIKLHNENRLKERKAANEAILKNQKRTNEDILTDLKTKQDLALKDLKEGTTTAKTEAQSASDEVKKSASTASSHVSNKVLTMKEKVLGAVREASDGVKSDASSAKDSVTSDATSMKDSVSGDFVSLRDAIDRESGSMWSSAESGARIGLGNMFREVDSGAGSVETRVSSLKDSISAEMSTPAASSESWGWDMLINFTNGINNAWNQFANPAITGIAGFIANMLGHSKPKIGPLKNDDVWFYHLGQNLAGGLERAMPLLERELSDVARHMSSLSDVRMDDPLDELMALREQVAAMDWDFDPMSSMVDNVRSSSYEMLRVMQDACEEARELAARSVDSAMEAIGGIGRGRESRLARTQGRAQAQSPASITVNVNLSGVSLGSDQELRSLADRIERIIAAKTMRSTAARIGR